MSLIAALADDLLDGLKQTDAATRQVLLWLDPDCQFVRLRVPLTTELEARGANLLQLGDGASQLELKLAILSHEVAGMPVVVHLPGRSVTDLDTIPGDNHPILWGLVDYRYRGAVWGRSTSAATDGPPSLDDWLIRRGIRFAGGSARAGVIKGGADSLLARYAARHANADVSQFPQPVSQQVLNVAGDPRDLLIELLLDPQGSISRWGAETADVKDLGSSSYGVQFDGEDPAKWADDIATHLALIEAWDALGRRDDFPFKARLPPGGKTRESALGLIRNAILPRSDVSERVRTLVSHREAELGGLVTWAANVPGVPALIPSLADRKVADLLSSMKSAGAPKLALDALAAGLPPSSAPGDNRFATMRAVQQLGERSARLQVALVESKTIAEMVSEYARDGWRVDDAYLRIIAACREDASLAPLRQLAGRLYADYLDATNSAFSSRVESDGAWPPEGVPGVTDAASGLWQRSAKAKDGRHAIIIVDALRLDIAQRLVERVGETSQIRVLASTLPTTTPFGMTALLGTPEGAIGVAASSSAVQLFADDSNSLEEREGRKAFIAKALASRGDSVAFVEVEQVLQGDPVPTTRFVVTFSYALDDRGHSKADGASLPDEAAKLPGRLARVIERLHDSGISRVDVVTDHGFLWLDPADVDALGTPAVPPSQVTKKAARYAILSAGAAAPELMHLALPFDPSIELGFPRGIRTLTKASWYAHGGVSLQESIIPQVTSRAAEQAPQVRPTFVVPIGEVVGATIPVRIAPTVSLPEGQLGLQSARPIRVRIAVSALVDGQDMSVADPVMIDVRGDSPEQVTAVYLREGRKLPAGTILTLSAVDDDTGESLYGHQLPLLTDWE